MPSNAPAKTRVLFVCIGNACRSQFAEALAKHSAFDVIEPSSAGLSPLGCVAPLVDEVLRERGIPLEDQHSKPIHPATYKKTDLVINMSGSPGERLFPKGLHVEDWNVDDPYGGTIEAYREACDEIEARLLELASRLRTRSKPIPASSAAR